jgi:hypothetical protein
LEQRSRNEILAEPGKEAGYRVVRRTQVGVAGVRRIREARDCGRFKTREQLLLEFADRDFESFDHSIDLHISLLRRKLGDDPASPRFILTIRSAGYIQKPGAEQRPSWLIEFRGVSTRPEGHRLATGTSRASG